MRITIHICDDDLIELISGEATLTLRNLQVFGVERETVEVTEAFRTYEVPTHRAELIISNGGELEYEIVERSTNEES